MFVRLCVLALSLTLTTAQAPHNPYRGGNPGSPYHTYSGGANPGPLYGFGGKHGQLYNSYGGGAKPEQPYNAYGGGVNPAPPYNAYSGGGQPKPPYNSYSGGNAKPPYNSYGGGNSGPHYNSYGSGHLQQPYNSYGHPQRSNVIDIQKISILKDDVDYIVETIHTLKENATELKSKLKDCFFGLNNILKAIAETGFKCEKGVLFGKLCITFSGNVTVSHAEAQSKCMEQGGTLFRPDISDLTKLPELFELLKDVIGVGFIESVSEVSIDSNGPKVQFTFTNGLIIPEDLIIACDPSLLVDHLPGSSTLRLMLVSAGPIPFQCVDGNILYSFFCQIDAIYKFDLRGIDITPTELEKELVKHHGWHKSLRMKLDEVHKDLEEASLRMLQLESENSVSK